MGFFSKSTSGEIKNEASTQILNNALDAVVTIDKNNNVVFFNPAAETLWGYRSEEVLGKNVRMLVPEIYQQDHDSYVDRQRDTGEKRIVGTSRQLELVRKDGSKVWVSLALSRTNIGNGSATRRLSAMLPLLSRHRRDCNKLSNKPLMPLSPLTMKTKSLS